MAETAVSTAVPFFLAAMIPSGIARQRATIVEKIVREIVGSQWLEIMLATVSLPATLMPKSPWKIFPIQTKYCSTTGLSSPIFARRAAISSTVASSPRMDAAGSPGVRCTTEKITTDTMIRTGMIESTRPTMNFLILSSPFSLSRKNN